MLVRSVDENKDVTLNKGEKEAENEVIPEDFFVINCEKNRPFT